MRPIWRPFAISVLGAASLTGCGSSSPDGGSPDLAAILREVEIPVEFQAGQSAYDARCADCHGAFGIGTDQGPPLVNVVYEPSHHADFAFHMAVERGVRAHHWGFGDMPPQPEVSREEVERIVGYVRFLQRQVGIV